MGRASLRQAPARTPPSLENKGLAGEPPHQGEPRRVAWLWGRNQRKCPQVSGSRGQVSQVPFRKRFLEDPEGQDGAVIRVDGPGSASPRSA